MTGRSRAAALMRRPGAWLIAAAALTLGAGSTALAAATGMLGHSAASSGATAGCVAPALAGGTVTVTVGDMGGGMMMGGAGWSGMGRMTVTDTPRTVAAGTVSLHVINTGRLVHEVLVLPLPTGQSVGQRPVGSDGKVDESSSVGEASRSCGEGAGDGVAPGTSGWVTLTLAPGRYELLCNIAGHYAAGAYAELDVS